MIEKEIEITDGQGVKHTLHLSAYHTSSNGRLGCTMIFDNGKGGHYFFDEIAIKEVLHLIIDEMM